MSARHAPPAGVAPDLRLVDQLGFAAVAVEAKRLHVALGVAGAAHGDRDDMVNLVRWGDDALRLTAGAEGMAE